MYQLNTLPDHNSKLISVFVIWFLSDLHGVNGPTSSRILLTGALETEMSLIDVTYDRMNAGKSN